MNGLLQDVRYAFRGLKKTPGFTTVAVLTLALGIGANTALFAIVNAVLLKPLPVPESDRIFLMSNQYPNAGSTSVAGYLNSSVPDYFDRLHSMTVFEEQAMYSGTHQSFDINGAPEVVRGVAATPSFFRLLGIAPAKGRLFDEREAEIGHDRTIILSDGLSQQLFGGSSPINQEVRLSGRPFTVVGVMPQSFQFADTEARFWIPLAFTAQQKSDDARHRNNWMHVARLKAGATIEQAQAQVNALNAGNLERFPQFKEILINAGFYTKVERLQDVMVRNIRPTLYLLWGGAGFVLLICGVNIANLTLARSSMRAREVATRLTLGAGRARVTRQLVTEGLLLALMAGAIGIAIGLGTLETLVPFGLDRVPRADEIHMDLTVVATALGLSAVIGMLIGVVPSARVSNVHLATPLRESNRTGTGGRKSRMIRRTLVVAQVAFAFVLLVGSGLLLASFRNLLKVDPGFTADRVITAGISMPRGRYATDEDVRAFTTRVLQAVRSVPGVRHAGGTTIIPLGGDHSDGVIVAEGYQMRPGESIVSPGQVLITPGYFDAMGTPLLRGRDFDERDDATSPGVVIVDERLAQKFWPGADPIGRRMYKPTNPRDLLSIDANTRWLTVVGVVREVQLDDLAGRPNSVGTYYFPVAQVVPRGLVLAIQTAGEPAAVLSSVRMALNKIDPAMPLSDVRLMTERTTLSLMPRKVALVLALSFAVVALFLSALGIYGVLAYVVTQRTREIGVRLALGSSARAIVALIVREGVVLIASGFVLGGLCAIAMRKGLEAQLFGLSATDPIVLLTVTTALALIALGACLVPALRAARVNPLVALRYE
ncbi:MAG TPA: ABC transporter permease [Vicinamibacterales bacterium]|nr:ABC transporter permease [Vicinamibacterales bacterium]